MARHNELQGINKEHQTSSSLSASETTPPPQKKNVRSKEQVQVQMYIKIMSLTPDS
jgi:hypothetical protein